MWFLKHWTCPSPTQATMKLFEEKNLKYVEKWLFEKAYGSLKKEKKVGGVLRVFSPTGLGPPPNMVLEIRKSSIPNGGLGLFVTCRVTMCRVCPIQPVIKNHYIPNKE